MAAYILPSFPVRSPRGDGSLLAPLLPSAQAWSLKERKNKRNRQNEKRFPPPPYSSSADAMKEGVGRNSGSSYPAPRSSASPSSSTSASRSTSRSRRSWSSHTGASLLAHPPSGVSYMSGGLGYIWELASHGHPPPLTVRLYITGSRYPSINTVRLQEEALLSSGGNDYR